MKRDALPAEITYGSVCSGIEAASVAWHPLGWRAAWVAEIEPFPARLLHHHYGSGRPLHMPDPDERNDDLMTGDRDARRAAIKAVSMLPAVTDGPRNLGDMTKIAAMVRAGQVAAPDVLVGGTPCQAFSIAGLRESLDDARGQLTLAFVNIANEIDTARHVLGDDECVIVWENVPGVLSTKDNAFGCFLGALAGEDSPLLAPGGKWPNAGCVFGPQRNIAWRVLDAQYFGVAQRRRRVFVVASARDGFDPAAVLFEPDGVRRDSPPSREAQQGATDSITPGAGAGSRHKSHWNGYAHPPLSQASQSRSGSIGASNQEIFEQGGAGLVQSFGNAQSIDLIAGGQLARCLTTKTRIDAETETLIPTIGGGFVDATATLDASYGRLQGCSGQDANHGHSHLVPTVAAPVQRSVERPRGDGLDSLIAFSVKDYGGDAMVDCAPTLRAGNHASSHANGGQPPAIAFDARQDCVSSIEVFGALGSSSPQAQAVCITGEVTHTLKAEGFDASEDGTGRGQPIVAATLDAAAGRSRGAGTPVGLLAPSSMAVRRLTPRECERLQSFPDFHTLIPLSKVKASRAETLLVRGEPVAEIDGQWWKLSADGPRYKALGNSMCVFNMRWIGRRVHFALTGAWPACTNFTHEREMGLVAA
ncbi:DNA cytosine methyltransferase [Duganella guangzhouensis]|uniref:DNA cytosine methyltransferase n=1 Tax=Duganella guangzhouensis TaxID=2666084 RepID=UPI001E2F3C1A|nr:DNA cytosine methyltransferase [Duganella guangzhouensis]